MVFGSVLAYLSEFRLDAADGQSVVVHNTMITRSVLKLFGVPHIGLRIRASLVMSEVRKLHPQTIIDAGSGNGLYTLEFAAQGFLTHGMELNQEKVARVEGYARELNLNNVSLQNADLTDQGQAIRHADVVICSDVLEHIQNDVGAVASLRALTSPGGTLIITVPRVSFFASRVENSFDHVRIGYTEEQLCKLLEGQGFKIVRTEQFFKLFGRMAWAADRYFRRSPSIRTLLFWPFYILSKLDVLMQADQKAGGVFIVARAPK